MIRNSVQALIKDLQVSEVKYFTTVGVQKEVLQHHDLTQKTGFEEINMGQRTLVEHHDSNIKYDLVHEIASRTSLTRRTVVAILKGLPEAKFRMFRYNPEEFIRKVSKIINEQKGALIVDHISYNTTEGTFIMISLLLNML